MKRLIYIMSAVTMMAVSLSSCIRENFVEGLCGDNNIVLRLTSPAGISSKALDEDAISAMENAIEHIDVLIFESTGTPGTDSKVYNEHIEVSDPEGTILLKKRRDEFDAGKSYYVYLVANSSEETIAKFEDIKNRAELFVLQQEDLRIHMTGQNVVTGQSVENIPDFFLMDAVAHLKGTDEPTAPQPVKLYDGNPYVNTELVAKLKRAAAKIIVEVTGGDAVEFVGDPEAQYYLRNMPYSTYVVNEPTVSASPEVRDPKPNAGQYFSFNEAEHQITYLAYAYSYKWATSADQTFLVVNIPMRVAERDIDNEIKRDEEGNIIYETDANGSDVFNNNYYRIPVCKDKELKRNSLYTVKVKINARGSTDLMNPAELENIYYEAILPWDEVELSVGDSNNKVGYLYFSTDAFEMHYDYGDGTGEGPANDTDGTTLRFSSSSAMTCDIDEIYFYNKYGQKVDKTDDLKDQISVNYDGLEGKVTVSSPKPDNNAVRYIVLKFTNEEVSEPKYITIAQYPLEYITNIQGWYSYREDFYEGDDATKVTTYERLNGQSLTLNNNEYTGNRIDNGEGRISDVKWDEDNSQWDYRKNGEHHFFSSKLAVYNTDGTADIQYYYWTEQPNNRNYTYARETQTSGTILNNGRIYHVIISSTSDGYVLGIPKTDVGTGYTSSGESNAKLVSPSFMIASQLGATGSSGINDLSIPAYHCSHYVEYTMDGKKYDNWRLPTPAEIKIICTYQKITGDEAAMDVLLTADYYWSSEGPVKILDGSVVSVSDDNRDKINTRCICDAYDD